MKTLNLILTLGLLALPVFSAEPGKNTSHPNVLFIVDDDLCATLGCFGGEAITPNLDAFAKRGEKFLSVYAQYPVCNPSRASFLSGWRPDRTGILSNNESVRKKFPDFVSLPQYFRQHGYFTACVGKIFHVGTDATGKMTLFVSAGLKMG